MAGEFFLCVAAIEAVTAEEVEEVGAFMEPIPGHAVCHAGDHVLDHLCRVEGTSGHQVSHLAFVHS